MKAYGYIRVSSHDQNEARQMDEMMRLQIPNLYIYMDKQSGKDFERPEYQLMIGTMQKGDLLYVTSVDRLGRNYEEILRQWGFLTKDIGIDICVLDMPMLDTRNGKDLIGTYISDSTLRLLSFVAQNERENIRRRQAEGIAAARQRGVHFGRPRAKLTLKTINALQDWQDNRITRQEVMKRCNFSRATLYRRLKLYRALEDC